MKTTRSAPSSSRRLLGAAAAAAALAACPALAWDASGHRLITLIALDNLRGDAPAFLRDMHHRSAIAENSTEPDRWRSVRMGPLMNANNPDHYLDVEDLEAYGLTLQTLPLLRYEFVSQMVSAREKAGADFKGRPVTSSARDIAKTDQWPGFAPYAVMENYAKLVSTFKLLRTIEKLDDPARAHQVAAAQASAVTIMGVMSHYVGDLAQPLHTTRHHHGWVGDNPNGYTTRYGIHSYIDGGVLEVHGLSYESMRGARVSERQVEGRDPWQAVLGHIQRSHDQVIPIYEMDKSGDLARDPGKEMITARLLDGASTLAALYNAAWESSEPSEDDVKNFLKYDGPPQPPTPPATLHGSTPAAAPVPGGS